MVCFLKGTTVNAFGDNVSSDATRAVAPPHMCNRLSNRACSALVIVINQECCDLTALLLLKIKSAAGV